MRQQWGNSTQVAKEIGCQFSPATDKIVRPRPIRAVCKAVWPNEKLDAFVADICGCSTRTAERYLSDEIDAPAALFAAILTALTGKR